MTIELYSKVDLHEHLKDLSSFLRMLRRTRAPTPSDCSTLKTLFSTLIAVVFFIHYRMEFIKQFSLARDDVIIQEMDMMKWFVWATNQFSCTLNSVYIHIHKLFS